MRWMPFALVALLSLSVPPAHASEMKTPLVCADASMPPPPAVGVLGQCPPVAVSAGNAQAGVTWLPNGNVLVYAGYCDEDSVCFYVYFVPAANGPVGIIRLP